MNYDWDYIYCHCGQYEPKTVHNKYCTKIVCKNCGRERMEGIYLDEIKVEVGSRMYSTQYGWGEVDEIEDYELEDYPICFISDSGYDETYDREGGSHEDCPRSLFWDEIKIIPPAPPKPKVKKWRWAVESFDGGHLYAHVTEHMTERQVREYLTCSTTIIGKIEATEIEEVE